MELQGKSQIQIEDYIEIILRRKWFIIIPFILSIIGIILALILSPPMYKSSTLILVEPQKISEAYIRPTVIIDIRDRLNTITQQVLSRTRLESVIKEFDLYHNKRERPNMDEIVGLMRKNVELNLKGDAKGKGLNSFEISYMGYDPETVMHVTNRLASLFIEENLNVREQQAEGTTEFLDSQLQNLKASLEKEEAGIKAFKEKYMGELPSQLETNLRTLDRHQLEIQSTSDILRGAEDRKLLLEKQLSEINPGISVSGGVVTSIDPMRSRLATLQAELSGLSATYTDKYPEIVRIKNEISEIEKELQRGKPTEKGTDSTQKTQPYSNNPLYTTSYNQLMDINADIKNLKEKQKEIAKSIAIFQGRVERIPTREQQSAALERDYGNIRGNYQNLLNKKLDAQLAENLEKRQKGEQFRILDPANLPSKPFTPDTKKIILLGIAIGLGSGGGLVFLLEYIDASFRKAEDVYAVIGIPVLASIPKVRISIP
jgi:polysaccharide chain length determinant protein (PEP-CTERM system associated)